MQITNNEWFRSFALGSTHVKFNVWPGPYLKHCLKHVYYNFLYMTLYTVHFLV